MRSRITRNLHFLHRFGGVVGDVDVYTDGFTVVVELERDGDHGKVCTI